MGVIVDLFDQGWLPVYYGTVLPILFLGLVIMYPSLVTASAGVAGVAACRILSRWARGFYKDGQVEG